MISNKSLSVWDKSVIDDAADMDDAAVAVTQRQSRIFLAGNQWLSLICEQVDDSAARVKLTLSDRRDGVAPVLLRVAFYRSSYEDGERQAQQWNKQQLY